MVILDTCCLIELCRPHPSISPTAYRMIKAQASILSVSFAEIALKIKQGKLTLNLSAKELYRTYEGIASVSIIAIGCEEWFDSIDLEWANKDPADRLIVAYAQKTGSPIATTDKRISEFYRRVIW